MSVAHLTPALVERTKHILDASGIVDLLAPPREPGKAGRIGRVRENVWLFCFGVMLCTRLGRETTVTSVHEVLTQALSLEEQWRYGVLRASTTTGRAAPKNCPPGAKLVNKHGKRLKRLFDSDGFEEVGYNDLHNATTAIREKLDYGHGSAPALDDLERARRKKVVEDVVDALLDATTIPRLGDHWAIDATGQWAWTRGRESRKRQLLTALGEDPSPARLDEALELAEIAVDDEDGSTAPGPQEAPANSRRCLDAQWGYKTSKSGKKGFGLHQHTVVRVPDPTSPSDSEPLLVDGLVITPANADAAEASLGLIRRLLVRHPGKVRTLIGDLLYSNLKADRWAIPLAQLGVEQNLDMRADQHGVLGVMGGQLQHAWLYCPSAPLEHKPAVPDSRTASAKDWTDFHEESNAFRAKWAFDRKESGLRTGTTKWVCPAMAGKVGCPARGTDSVTVAIENDLFVVEPPTDWKERACCTQRTVDITHDPAVPALQRKLLQREHYGSERWRKVRKLRSYVEGVFGTLKNPSRQRLTRGQNRLPGLTMATLIAGLKVAVYNEETLRTWHERTGRGPAGHPLLQEDPAYHGYEHLSAEKAAAINQQHLVQLGMPGVPAPRAPLDAAQGVTD